MADYQIIWILAGNTPPAAIDTSLEQLKGFISTSGGETKKAYLWEQRTLAYPIKKHEVGNYCIADFAMDSEKVPELEESVRADQSILRFLVSRA